MALLYRWEPRRSLRSLAAWFLILSCGLSVAAAPGAPAAQYLVRRAEVPLSVADAERAALALESLARTVGGRFAGDGVRVLKPPDDLPTVEATLELPPEMLDIALARLRGMSLLVLEEKVESLDVGDQMAELNRRLEGLWATHRELDDLMQQAATEVEQRQVQTALSQAEADIAETETALAALRQQVNWAVIRIVAHEAPPTPTPSATPAPSRTPRFTPIPVTPSPTPWRPGETVKQAKGVLVSIVQGLTDVLIVLAVVIGPFLVLAVILWWLRRWVRGWVRGRTK